MDSHSRSASPREPMRPQHRPPSPPASPGAFDNRAYTHDEDPNHNDSFTSNGPQQNGHSKEPNGDTKLPEAVNLELINLTPKNGTKKKDVEVDMNTSNPYDEYFVPVNEHRKFMRGEKLYVTADKRGEKSGCKRPLCWTLLVLVVAAIIALIVLAATGILFSSSPTPLEQYNTSVSSARAFGGIGGHDSHDHDHSSHDHDHSGHDHEHDDGYPVTTTMAAQEHGPEQNDEPSVVDENDMSLYVPRTVEGELTIDNEEFSPELEDPESAEYREFVSTFTDGLKKALFDRNTLENGDNDVIVEVVTLRKGSVIVTYRIHWKPKINTESTPDLLTAESLKSKLDAYLSTNNRMINVYHIYEGNTPTKPVLDICQIDNNQCEHGCEFDEVNLEFTCTCPYGQMLDMTNPKKCMSILENTYPLTPNENTEVKILETNSNPITTKPVPEEEKPATETVPISINDSIFDWKEPHHALPETTTQSEADIHSSHIFGHGNEHTEAPDHESAEASPEPTAEPKTEPEPIAEPNPEPEPNTEPKPEPEPTAEPNVEPEPTAEPKTEPEPFGQPKYEPGLTIEHSTESGSEPQPTLEPKAEPEPTAEPKAEPEPTAEPKAEPEPTAEPKAEPEPTAEPKIEPEISFEHKIYPESKHQPAEEPNVAPEPNAEPKVELEAAIKEVTPESEATAQETSKAEPEPIAEFKPVVRPYQEPTFEHESTTESGSNSEIRPNPEVVMELKESGESNETKPESDITSELHTIGLAEGDTGSPIEFSAEPGLEVKPKTESPTSMISENESSDKNVSGLEVIHIIPFKTAESTPIPTYVPITTSEPRSEETNTPINIHEILDQANNQDSFNTLDAKTNAPVLIAQDNSESQTERDTDVKPADETENTTLRVSISEPNIINEPSYEPKPEIISIFNVKNEGETKPKFVTENYSEPTTDHSEWLQNNFDQDVKRFNVLENTDISNNHRDSEERSFKSGEIFAEEVTTEKATEHEILSGQMLGDNTESKMIKKDDGETTTHIIDHIESGITEKSEETPISNSVTNDMAQTVMSESINNDNKTESNSLNESENDKEKPQVSIPMHEGRSLDTNKSSSTNISNDSVREYSINDQFNSSETEKHLMDALINKKETETETTTKKFVVDDGVDITFDSINMLYNRSSHSLETNKESKPDVTESVIIETTTVSDWLSEPVTEIKFEDAMNKKEKHETTETSNSKIDEIINNGVTKNDFEPDYLNNMSSNNNKMKEDIPLYGITHDYDSEDSRVKRVNKEKDSSKEISKINVTNESAVTESNLPSIRIETTTVIDYIYKTAEKVINDSSIDSVPQNNPDITSSATTTSTEKAEPAPVWEDSETDKNVTVVDLETPTLTLVMSSTTPAVYNDKIIVTTTPLPTKIFASSDASAVTLSSEATSSLTTANNIEEASNSDIESQTKVNNLNVTIYEISSHNRNNSYTVTNQHSAEFEDHDIEMNPFLPEVENNKSLVKKLQEGHDIEPTTFNETQNENTEDHSNNTTETAQISDNGNAMNIVEESKFTTTVVPSTTVAFATFDELMKSNTPKTDTDIIKSENVGGEHSEEKNRVPISTFLLDTDDLDNSHTTERKTTITRNNIENEAVTPSPASPVDLSDESDYLSVVPIEEERLEEKESLKKDYGSEFNNISDSPKKSDRRTLDETKFDSVNDNEA